MRKKTLKWKEVFSKRLLGEGKCPDYCESDVANLLEVHKCAFSDSPGLCKVGSCEIVVKGGSSVVNIPSRQIPIHIQSSVEREINKLLKAEIIVPANEEWSSPIVPIRKKDP